MKGLERTLGLRYVVAISIGAMLGSGIFVLPGLAAAKTGHSVWLAYLAAGIAVLPAALAKAEMATAMPTSGGTYVFVDRAFGPLVGTMTGLGLWISLLLKSAFALVGFGAYLDAVHHMDIETLALVLLAVIVVLNLMGVKTVGKVMLLVVTLALAGLVVLALRGFTNGDLTPPQRFFADGGGGFFAATAFVFVSYAGVTKVAAIAEEVKRPERNLPLGIILSLGVVVAVYTTVSFVLVELLPMEQLTSSLSPIHELAQHLVGPSMAVGFAVLGVVTMASMSNAGMLAASRFPFAMSRDRLLPPALSWLHPERRTPVISTLLTGVVMALAIHYLDVERMAKIASGFKIAIFGLVNVALIVVRESGAQWYRPKYRAPLYPALPIFGIVSAIVLLAFIGGGALLAVLGICVPGAVLYLLYGRRRTTRTGILQRIKKRPDLVAPAAPAGAIESVTETIEGEASVTVALMGWERSPEVLVEVGAALADGRPLEVLSLREAEDREAMVLAQEETATTRSLRRRILAMAKEEELDLHIDDVASRDLVRTAHEIANRLHCEWLVMAWRGRRARHRFLFLNPLGWLINHLPCNLALFRDAGVRYYRQILAIAEPGPDDALVVSTADHLAARSGAVLTFVSFVPDDASKDELREQSEYLLQLRALCKVKTRSLIVRGTDMVRAVVRVTAAYDLLVTSASTVNSPWIALRGTPSDRLKEQAHCSVLSLKTPPGTTHGDTLHEPPPPLAEGAPFDLLDHVDARCVEAGVPVQDKKALFGHLARTFSVVRPDDSVREVQQLLWRREREQNTGVGLGLAIPHTMLPSSMRTTVGVFTLASLVDYGGADGPVDVVIAAVGPPADRQTHLQILATVSRLAVQTPLLERLRAAGSPQAMLDAIRDEAAGLAQTAE